MNCCPGHCETCVHCQGDGGRLPDVDATEKMVEAYAAFDAARSEEKATRFQSVFTAWGSEANGRRGIVHVSLAVGRCVRNRHEDRCGLRLPSRGSGVPSARPGGAL